VKFGRRGAWLTRRATDVGQWDPSRERNAVSQDGSADEYKDYSLTGHYMTIAKMAPLCARN
jgi:hypothetical protein